MLKAKNRLLIDVLQNKKHQIINYVKILTRFLLIITVTITL